MLGIAKLKAGILLAVAFFNQGKESAADGFKPTDLFSFIDEVMQVQGVVASAADMKAELEDLDLAERAEIINEVKAALNVDDAKAEEIVGACIDFIAATYAGIKVLTA